MRDTISKDEIKELSEIVLNSFLKEVDIDEMSCIDIEGVANHLGLTIRYENIAEPDKNKIAFFSDGKMPLTVYRNKKICMVKFPFGTIVLDNFLRQVSLSSKRRYTIAHEIGHFILEKYGYAPLKAQFYNEFSSEYQYSLKELNNLLNINEMQANEIGAFLLMPQFLVSKYIVEVFKESKICVYGDHLMTRDTKYKVELIANRLGVSYTALMIQLKKLKLIEYNPAEKFCEVLLK